MVNFLTAVFLVAHGIVHPLLAYLPSRDEAEIVGGLWTNSWLLGGSSTAKRWLWVGSTLTAVLFALTGLSMMGWIIPQDWWHTLVILSAGASLLVLVIFWFTEFFIGVIIDVVVLGLVLMMNWNPFLAA